METTGAFLSITVVNKEAPLTLSDMVYGALQAVPVCWKWNEAVQPSIAAAVEGSKRKLLVKALSADISDAYTLGFATGNASRASADYHIGDLRQVFVIGVATMTPTLTPSSSPEPSEVVYVLRLTPTGESDGVYVAIFRDQAGFVTDFSYREESQLHGQLLTLAQPFLAGLQDSLRGDNPNLARSGLSPN